MSQGDWSAVSVEPLLDCCVTARTLRRVDFKLKGQARQSHLKAAGPGCTRRARRTGYTVSEGTGGLSGTVVPWSLASCC